MAPLRGGLSWVSVDKDGATFGLRPASASSPDPVTPAWLAAAHLRDAGGEVPGAVPAPAPAPVAKKAAAARGGGGGGGAASRSPSPTLPPAGSVPASRAGSKAASPAPSAPSSPRGALVPDGVGPGWWVGEGW